MSVGGKAPANFSVQDGDILTIKTPEVTLAILPVILEAKPGHSWTIRTQVYSVTKKDSGREFLQEIGLYDAEIGAKLSAAQNFSSVSEATALPGFDIEFQDVTESARIAGSRAGSQEATENSCCVVCPWGSVLCSDCGISGSCGYCCASEECCGPGGGPRQQDPF